MVSAPRKKVESVTFIVQVSQNHGGEKGSSMDKGGFRKEPSETFRFVGYGNSTHSHREAAYNLCSYWRLDKRRIKSDSEHVKRTLKLLHKDWISPLVR